MPSFLPAVANLPAFEQAELRLWARIVEGKPDAAGLRDDRATLAQALGDAHPRLGTLDWPRMLARAARM